jgi:hypothetical protein
MCVSESGGKQRQTHSESRSLPLGALELNGATVKGHAPLDDEQAQARARNLSHIAATMECLEQSLLVG